MPSIQSELDKVNKEDFYRLIGLDDQVMYGYVDMDLFDENLLLIPLPDKKHWLEPISTEDDKRTIFCHIWAYDENEKQVERVTVCEKCGTLVSAVCTVKKLLCPDCLDFEDIAHDS